MKIFYTAAIALLILSNQSLAADVCQSYQNAVRHQARADVNVGNDNTIAVADPIKIPVTYDFIRNIDIDPISRERFETVVGVVSVYKDGRILYDGRDISSKITGYCDNGTTGSITIVTETK